MLPRNLGRLIDLAALAAALGAALRIAPHVSVPARPFGDWGPLVIVFAFASVAALGGYRLALRVYYGRRRAAGHYSRDVLLIGSRPAVAWLARYFADFVALEDRRVVGWLAIPNDASDVRPPYSATAVDNAPGVPLLGRASDLGALLICESIQEIIIISAPHAADWISEVIYACKYLGLPLRVVPAELLPSEPDLLPTLYPDQPFYLPAVEFAPPAPDGHELWLKRLLDVAGSILLIIALSPVILAVAAAVKASAPRLPVFYRWHVVGWHGRRFTGYKFRTMIQDADEQKSALLAHNEMIGPAFKMANDPRVTRLGRFLRKHSLDELPQLWSVLKGDMSLVGPRPALPYEVDRYQFWHKRRLSVRPGITCTWQVRGRHRIYQFDDWARMDLEYIDRWTLSLDMSILLHTVPVVLSGTGV